MSRLLLTPTFAVGIGTVIAAILAYGTTQTHLLFSGLGPPCAVANCSSAQPDEAGGAPLRISATPARSGPARPAHGSLAGGDPGPNAIGGPAGRPLASGRHRSPAHTPPPGPGVSITYQTLRQWHGGFIGALTITSHSRSVLAGWRLWLGYPSGWIDGLAGASWLAANHHQAAVASAWPGQVLRPGASVQILFSAHGQAGEPSGCVFNGTRCGYSGGS